MLAWRESRYAWRAVVCAPLNGGGQCPHKVCLRDHAYQLAGGVHDRNMVVSAVRKQRHQIHCMLRNLRHLDGVRHDLAHPRGLPGTASHQRTQPLASQETPDN